MCGGLGLCRLLRALWFLPALMGFCGVGALERVDDCVLALERVGDCVLAMLAGFVVPPAALVIVAHVASM